MEHKWTIQHTNISKIIKMDIIWFFVIKRENSKYWEILVKGINFF